MTDQKPFKASPEKLKKAKENGEVVKSQLLTQAIVLLFSVILATYAIPLIWVRNQILLEYTLTIGFENPLFCLKSALMLVFTFISIFLLIASCISVLTETLQSGSVLSLKILSPKLDKFNLANGVKKIVDSAKDLWLNYICFFSYLLASFYFFPKVFKELTSLSVFDLSTITANVILYYNQYLVTLLTIFLFTAYLDYLVKKSRFYKKQSMSAQEVKRESKDNEGDANIKMERKNMHESLLFEDLKMRVKNSKVIIVERA